MLPLIWHLGSPGIPGDPQQRQDWHYRCSLFDMACVFSLHTTYITLYCRHSNSGSIQSLSTDGTHCFYPPSHQLRSYLQVGMKPVNISIPGELDNFKILLLQLYYHLFMISFHFDMYKFVCAGWTCLRAIYILAGIAEWNIYNAIKYIRKYM